MENPQKAHDVLVAAVVLAAGQSRRMGEPKLILPWGERTVIQQVVDTLKEAKIQDIVVVTGAARQAVERVLSGEPIRFIYNPDHAKAEMLTSLQVGIRAVNPACSALLVVLGDQPMISVSVVAAVLDAFLIKKASLVVPSYQMRRGHPWLAARSLWQELLAMPVNQTMHDFLENHASDIHYVNVDSPGILKDMDTPEEYRAIKPGRKD